MESFGKGHPSSGSSLPSSAARKNYAVSDVIITQRLRDREMLRRRREEALEKESAQWILRVHKNQRQKRRRRTKRGRGRQAQVKATLNPEPTVEPQPELQKEAEQVHSEPAPSEPALPEPVLQEQLPMMTIENPIIGMPAVAGQGELASGSLDPAGEEDVMRPSEADILELFNTSLENVHQDNPFNAHFL